MRAEPLWQKALGLTDRVFQVTSNLNLPRGNQWPTVVIVSLSQANERLDSVRVLLDKNHWDSAVILTRSLFELAVNLAYIAKDVSARLPKYLGHGGIPLTREDANRLQEELQKGSQPAIKDIVPGRAWEPLKAMCTDLGCNWLKEYDTFYRYASVPTHAGAFTLGKSYQQLLEQQSPSDRNKAKVLITSLDFHLRIAEIAAKTFPNCIGIKEVKKLREECSNLGQSLLIS